jgi:hypothetical protein
MGSLDFACAPAPQTGFFDQSMEWKDFFSETAGCTFFHTPRFLELRAAASLRRKIQQGNKDCEWGCLRKTAEAPPSEYNYN